MKQLLGNVSAGGRVRVWCPGRPRTKGSLKPVHIRTGAGRCRVSLTESGEYAIAWKQAMIDAVREGCECTRYEGPVMVDLSFRFERLCKPDVDLPWPTRQAGEFAHGDVDKLARNAYDALTQAGLIKDDSLIVGGTIEKRWDLLPGVLITVVPA